MNPKISVVMSVYKGAAEVAGTVRSVLDQSFKDFEFIVVIDGPDPEIESVLSEIKDPRLHVVPLPQNIGITRALNEGLALCRGKYFARMDNGDFCDRNRLQMQLDAVERTGFPVAFCQARIEDDESNLIELTTNMPWNLRLWQSMFCQSLGTAGTALFVSVELLRSSGCFDESFRYAQDFEICERLAHICKEFAYTEEVGVKVPLYPGGISRTKRVAQEEFVRRIMERATRRYLPEVTQEELSSFAFWRRRFPLEGETDPMPAIRCLPRLAKAFREKQGLKHLPFEVCNDISEATETHFLELGRQDRWTAMKVMLWCAWECKSLRLYKFAAGALKRRFLRRLTARS